MALDIYILRRDVHGRCRFEIDTVAHLFRGDLSTGKIIPTFCMSLECPVNTTEERLARNRGLWFGGGWMITMAMIEP